MIQNKESLVYSLENSINNLESVVKKSVKINTPQQREVYSSLGTALLWIGSCLDRLENMNIQMKNLNMFKHLKGAYNVQKHGVNLVGFTGFISGSSFPIRFPMRFGEGNYYFKELNEDIVKNKDIIKSVQQIKAIILDKMK